jgi:hypothetical protein
MSSTGEELYKQREQRFNDIVALRRPDRVPIVPHVIHYFATKVKGISNRDAGYDHKLHYDAIKEATIRFGWDFTPTNGMFAADGYEALGTTQLRWPGGDLADDASFQFVEGEYMKADEYDEFLADPNGFTLTRIFPRIAGNLEGLGQVPFPPLYWLANTYYLMNVGGPLLAAPPVRKALESLLAMSDAVAGYFAADAANAQEMAALGYPRTWGAPIIPAFDMVSDMFRSLRGSTLDMYRHPEQLLKTIDLVQQGQIALAMMVMQVTGNPRVFIPMHRGAGVFQGPRDGHHRGRRCAQPSVRGRLHPAPQVPRRVSGGQGGRSLRQGRPQGLQGGPRRQDVLLGQRAGLDPVHRHAAAGQGRRQGACRPLRRHGRPDARLGARRAR